MKILRKNKKYYPYLLLLPTVTTLLVVTVYPLIYTVGVSLYDLNITRPLLSKFVGIGNYKRAFLDVLVWQSIYNTFIYTAGAVGLQFFIGLGIALLLHRESKASLIVRSSIFLPMMMTPAVAALLWRLMYNPHLGIINYMLGFLGIKGISWLGSPRWAMFSLIIVDCWQWIPFMVLLLLAGLQALPKEPYEAAVVDGASGWKTFKFITFPLLKPTIIIALLFRVLDSFRIFDPIYLLTDGGPGFKTELFSLWVYRNCFKFFMTGYGSALAVIMLIIAMVMCQFFIKLLKFGRT